MARRKHHHVHTERAASHKYPTEPALLIGEFRQHLEDATTSVKANPIARDEDERMSDHTGTWDRIIHPPADGVLSKSFKSRHLLPRTRALLGAHRRHIVDTRLPTNVEVNEGGHCDPELCRNEDADLLQAHPVGRAEKGPHDHEGRQVPHRPIEAQQRPEHEEDRFAVGKTVRLHTPRVVETAEEGQARPATTLYHLQQEELVRPIVST
mmetsp:Transcript_135998/g.290720  ORF Transcript_135998/g.290720 Transcript_135998/m.290720 type:complete len:209 (-) Transcript_135998:2636-3262(-)